MEFDEPASDPPLRLTSIVSEYDREPLGCSRVGYANARTAMFKILVPAVAAIGLVALAAKTQAVASEDTTTVTQSIAAEPVLGWYVSYEGSMAKLAYGVANSDQLSMMVTCAPGDRSAVIYGDVVPASPHIIQASTGGEGDEARVPLSDPSLRSLARNGVMPVVGVTGPERISATSDERRVVDAFLSYCSGGRA